MNVNDVILINQAQQDDKDALLEFDNVTKKLISRHSMAFVASSCIVRSEYWIDFEDGHDWIFTQDYWTEWFPATVVCRLCQI